jgi:hypothetical protein
MDRPSTITRKCPTSTWTPHCTDFSSYKWMNTQKDFWQSRIRTALHVSSCPNHKSTHCLVLQCHEDIHHQSHIMVLHVLKALYYWPGMSAHVERLCTACQTCLTASVRRKHLKTTFDAHTPQSTAMPRQDYGIDFYGVFKGEIMVIVDLFTRETILTYLDNRTQDNVFRPDVTQKRHISTRSPTITPNRKFPRTIITHRSSVSNL